MDRNRENSRRGSFSGAHPVSAAPRRPRTSGFKDSSGVDDEEAMEESHNSRLRERSKKESMIFSAARHKRTRPSSREYQAHSRSAAFTEEIYETTEDADTMASDEDEDHIPPAIPRRSGKLRLQGKMQDENNAVTVTAVPRKARTAITKRVHEFSQPLISVGRQQLSGSLTPQPYGSTSLVLGPASKLSKRTKPNGTKVRVSKLTKVSESSTISQQEAEVAEALFDLSRMVTSQGSPFASSDGKPDSEMEELPAEKRSTKAQSTARTAVPSSTSPGVVSEAMEWSNPSLVVPASAEARKKKQPRVKSSCEDSIPAEAQSRSTSAVNVGVSVPNDRVVADDQAVQIAESIEVHTRVNVEDGAFACQAAGASFGNHESPDSDDAVKEGQPESFLNEKGATSTMNMDVHASSGNLHDSAFTVVSSTRVAGQLSEDIERTVSASEEIKGSFVDGASARDPVSISLAESKAQLPNCESGVEPTQHTTVDGSKEPDACGSLRKAGVGNSSPKAYARETTTYCKYEIDLMAPPRASASGSTEQTGSSRNSARSKIDERKGSVQDEKDDAESVLGSTSTSTTRDVNCLENHMEKITDLMKLQGKDVEQEDPKQILRDDYKLDHLEPEKPEARQQHMVDRSSIIATSSLDCPTTIASTPVSYGPAVWPGRLSEMGYYSPAAAAAAAVAATWPAPGLIDSVSSTEQNGPASLKVPAFLLSGAQSSCKRCATHVFIAHFIDTQQQMHRHPFWVSSNAAASMYPPLKSYNLNMPFPMDPIYKRTVGGLASFPQSNTICSKGVDCSNLSQQSEKGSGIENPRGLSEKVSSLHMEAPASKSTLEQPTHLIQQQHHTVATQSSTMGSVFGCPPTQVTPSSHDALTIHASGSSMVEGSSNLTHGRSAASLASCMETMAATSGANPASAQVQYMQAIIQQAGFPFPFTPGQFVHPAGHVTQQQATHFLGAPLYNSSSVPPSVQVRNSEPAVAKSSSLYSHHSHLQQGQGVTIPVSLQQQPPPSSASSTQSQQRVASQGHQPTERERAIIGETASSAESKYSSYKRSMYSHGFPDMQVPTLSSSSSTCVPSLRVQDFTLAGPSLVDKQSECSSLATQQKQPSLQEQAQQHAGVSFDLSEHHSTNSEMPLLPKGLELPASMHMGVVNRSMAGSAVPSLMGSAQACAVMAPQTPAVVTMTQGEQACIQNFQKPTYQQKYLIPFHKASAMDETLANIEENNSFSGNLDKMDDKRTHSKQVPSSAGLSTKDLEAIRNAQAALAYNSGNTSLPPTRMPSSSGPLMNMAVISGTRQVATMPLGCVIPAASAPSPKPSTGRTKGNINMTAAAAAAAAANPMLNTLPDQALLNKLPMSGAAYYGQNSCEGNYNFSQGQTVQYTTQTKSLPRGQLGTASISTAPASMDTTSMYNSDIVSKHSAQYSRAQQHAAMNQMQSSPPNTSSASSAAGPLHSPSLPSFTKSSAGVGGKSIPPTKSPYNMSQIQSLPNSGRPGPATILGSSPSFSNGAQPDLQQDHQQQHQQRHHQHQPQPQSQPQPLQQQQQQQVHTGKQQTQHYHVFPQQLQHFPQSPQQQAQGIQSNMTLQYHQPSTGSAAATKGSRKQLAHQGQVKSQLYLQPPQSHYLQQQPQQVQTVLSFAQQQSEQQEQTGLSYALQHFPDMKQHSDTKQLPMQSMLSHQPPMVLSSFGAASSGGLSHSSPVITFGNYRPLSSDGSLNQVTRSSVGSSSSGFNYQVASANSVSAVSGSQAAATGGGENRSQQPSFTAANNSLSVPCASSEVLPFSSATAGEILLPGSGSVRLTHPTQSTAMMNHVPSPLHLQGAPKKSKGQQQGSGTSDESATCKTFNGSPNQASFPSACDGMKFARARATPPYTDSNIVYLTTPAAMLQGSGQALVATGSLNQSVMTTATICRADNVSSSG